MVNSGIKQNSSQQWNKICGHDKVSELKIRGVQVLNAIVMHSFSITGFKKSHEELKL